MSKKVWLYCRTARENVPTLENQIKVLKEFAKSKGLKIIGITSEFGSGLNLNRKGIMKIKEVAKNKRSDMILTKDFSRISRSFTDCFQITEEIEKHIPFKTMNNFDTESEEEFKSMTKTMYDYFKSQFKEKHKKVDQTASDNLI